jgi:hypothetical protein
MKSAPKEDYLLKFLAANSGMLSLADMTARVSMTPVDLVTCLEDLKQQGVIQVKDPDNFLPKLLGHAEQLDDEQLYSMMLKSPELSSQVMIMLSEYGFRMSRQP